MADADNLHYITSRLLLLAAARMVKSDAVEKARLHNLQTINWFAVVKVHFG